VIQLRFFGALRKYADANGFYPLPLDAGQEVSAGDVKRAVLLELSRAGSPFDPTLISQSVLADETSIVQDHEVIRLQDGIALLPPVCGG
jgi:molybdopterin converting factor small subunit